MNALHLRLMFFFVGLAGAILVPAESSSADWEKDWSQLLARARQEGKVVVSGPPSPIVRREIPARFRERFGIAVEYIGARSSETAAKLRAERQAGMFTVDVFLAGMDTMANVLHREKMLDPLRPVLILPEVVSPAKWKKGQLWFSDPEQKFVLRLFNTVGGTLHINTAHVQAGEWKYAKDFLNPKWKGKIATLDPTVTGSGLGSAAEFYYRFGEEFIRKLYIEQKPAFTRDRRQLIDWLARGSYPIAIAALSDDAERMQTEGFSIAEIFELGDMPGSISAGTGQAALTNNAPHPNAAAVFVNWIASKEGMEVYARAYLKAPTRNDIDESYLRPEVIPRSGVDYWDSAAWDYAVTKKEQARVRLKEILAK